MAKSILYRWFGFGKIPERYRSDMEKEGIILQDEGLSIVVRYRNFRAPYVYYGRKISLIMGSVVLTKNSFACFRGNVIPPVFHVPVSHESFKAFDISLDEKARLRIVIDAAAFQEGWKGTIDCRIPCDNSENFLRALTALKNNM
ncbi:MAG: hypothetical protein DIZ80_00325 [endosymbiont of Galathealinum brachiosum]|uniref:Uncharacterized protein n=1 Tax=endosymbiont of Galathealinum brachiosum TaxID=2200906 RepID=A0A370DNT1_9GAMM|nr:MAG: hypothetical protein DIZ80_00325 [endosymbiont of Galathealinum brachiosum]